MELWQKVLIYGFSIVSVVIFIAAVVLCIIRIAKSKHAPEKRSKAGVSTALIFSGFLILSIWILRVAIGFSGVVSPGDDIRALSWGEEVFNGFFAALRTFSLEEDYADYIGDIKEMVYSLVSDGGQWREHCLTIFVVYATVLNIIAPVAGGAIILEVLAKIFPKIKLRWVYLNFRRKKYYFSELNATSLALAKSISVEKKKEKPVLIFTDTYVDDEKEKEYELLLEAKQYGAICLRDDLAHVVKSRFGKREYYLMDENEFGNLQTLMGLIDERNAKYIKNSYIYLFVQSDAYVQIEKRVNKKLETDAGIKKALKGGKRPIIVPVRGYRNLVHKLFVNVPLYEPLVRKADPTKLSLTILGNGIIGTEAFISAYWFGQMMVSRCTENQEMTMTECELTINVVSKDAQDVFWSKIDYINPEIKETIQVLEESSDIIPGDILCCDRKGTKNNPYCKVRYIQADVKIGGFWDGETEAVRQLLDSDYFVVALGNDADNISVAEKLRSLIGKKHLEATSEEAVANTVITFAVFDPSISEALGQQKFYQSRDRKKTDIYMHPFGCLTEVYSCENVYMSKNLLWAEETGRAYHGRKNDSSHIDDNRKRTEENSNYDYWANLARAMHVKYKVFSLGWIDTSLFDCCNDKSAQKHYEKVKESCKMYKRLAVLYAPQRLAQGSDEQKKYLEIEKKKHCLAWIEHRRWCAFTRTMGYRRTNLENSITYKESHKEMSLKLHSCLVEARRPALEKGDKYILAKFNEFGKVDSGSILKDNISADARDFLDDVSYTCKDRGIKNADFKEWDYYRYELDEYLFEDDLKKELESLKLPKFEEYCAHKLYSDCLECNTNKGVEYLISINSVKMALRKKYASVDKKENERLFELCEKGKVRGAKKFHDSWFAKKYSVRKAERTVKRFEKEKTDMKNIDMYIDSFRTKYEAFLLGCDSIEEMELWDKETLGEMDAFYANDLASVIIRLIAADGRITQKEVDYLNETFGFDYALDELTEVYNNSKENIGEAFDENFENGISHMKKINQKLADAYKELLSLVCEIIIESDGIIAAEELAEVERLKAMCE